MIAIGSRNSQPAKLRCFTGSLQTRPFDFWKASRTTANKAEPFDAWLRRASPAYNWDWPYLVAIREQLDRITTGDLRRLAIFVPPRHGKSALATIRYPVYRLGCEPGLRVIVGCYNSLLAEKFSRQSLRLAREQGVPLNTERQAAHDWETLAGGGLRAVGVGGGITGQGGDLIVIDDPVKSREEANSPTYRERVWDWYTNDLYTRLEPKSAIVLIQCMTGDTPVLMADGTERPLREIKAGDQVATYDNGRLGTSTVQNHKRNGIDYVFTIKTTCGKIVHANKRHPFLVEEHGQLKWIRLRDLKLAHRIVTVRDSGASGRAKLVLSMAARNTLVVEDIARHTTTKSCGLTGIAHRLPVPHPGEMLTSSTDTALPPQSMMPCLRRKAASALFANSRRETTHPHIGKASCALTTVTKQTQSEGFCATTVTLPLGTPRQRQPRSLWLNTCDFTTEAIESIEPAGVEEVFDLQIERTENFIANGLVSHNTRWHDDDLAGRILASETAGEWTVLSLPAEAEAGDLLGRALGEPLCADRFDRTALADIRATLGTWAYTALYQQRPMPAGGGMFKREWLPIVEAAPAQGRRVRYYDKAGTPGGGDYSVGVLLSRTADGVFYIEHVVRGQWSALERERILRQTAELDGPSVAIWLEQEPGSGGKESAEASVRSLSGFTVHAEPVTGAKDVRAAPFAAQCEAGNVRLVRGAWNGAFIDELLSFPSGAHDDQVDAAAGAFNKLAAPRKPGGILVQAAAKGW